MTEEGQVSTTEVEDSVQINMTGEINNLNKQDKKHEVSIKHCPVKNVTVFSDRAEVNRIVEQDLMAGDNEVLVKDLPAPIDQDSIRVTCFGSATIVEVAYQSKAVSSRLKNAEEIVKNNESEAETTKKALKLLEKKKKEINEKIKSIEKERELLNEFSKCVSSKKEDKVADVMEKKSIENFLAFMTIYKERADKLTASLLEADNEIELIDQEIKVHEKNLKKLKPVVEEIKQERNVSILLEVSANDKVKLIVSYVVSNASWTPLYDVRAFNKDSTVQVLYFATIKQNTGEDWDDAKLSLSTAMPNVGGSPPKLSTKYLYLNSVMKPFSAGPALYKSKRVLLPTMSSRAMSEYDPTIEDEFPSESSFLTAMATEGLTSATFEIARTATIKSDDVGHKVSIAQLDFKPNFEYIATPKLVAHTFLKVKAKNESTYAMLAGGANIFLDNNFLTKSFLPAVSPMEEFEIALGSDPSVKIEYKPVQKYEQTAGMMSKSKIFSYHQVIEIKNTKSEAITITVRDQCPKSGSDKIKVTLQDPEIKFPKNPSSNEQQVLNSGNAKLNLQDFSIDWSIKIAPTETKKINLKYQVEHPAGYRLSDS